MSSGQRRRRLGPSAALFLLLLVACTASGGADAGVTDAGPTASPAAASAAASASPTPATAHASSSAPATPDPAFAGGTITLDELPPQARWTIDLIDAGGPFPHEPDGSIFRNREGLLPDRPPGYYREYTVETPGSYDRGARRIVAGSGGELYYTDDHYDSFRWVLR